MTIEETRKELSKLKKKIRDKVLHKEFLEYEISDLELDYSRLEEELFALEEEERESLQSS